MGLFDGAVVNGGLPWIGSMILRYIYMGGGCEFQIGGVCAGMALGCALAEAGFSTGLLDEGGGWWLSWLGIWGWIVDLG